MEAKSLAEPDFWSVIAPIELQMYKQSRAADWPAPDHPLEKACQGLHKRVDVSWMWSSVYDTALFVLQKYTTRAPPEGRESRRDSAGHVSLSCAAEVTLAVGPAATTFPVPLPFPKVVWPDPCGRDILFLLMRVNIKARIPIHLHQEFHTLPLVLTIEKAGGLATRCEHRTTAAELMWTLDQKTDIHANLLDSFRQKLRLIEEANLRDVEVSDEVLNMFGFSV